jgi:hypothetical protein
METDMDYDINGFDMGGYFDSQAPDSGVFNKNNVVIVNNNYNNQVADNVNMNSNQINLNSNIPMMNYNVPINYNVSNNNNSQPSDNIIINKNYSNEFNNSNSQKLYNNCNTNLPNNNNNGIKSNRKCPCFNCSQNFIKCSLCAGLFLPKIFKEKHQELCQTLHRKYEEKFDVFQCPECSCIVKFSDYTNHIKTCASSNFNNQQAECQFCKKHFKLTTIDEHEKQCEKIQTSNMLLNEKLKCSVCDQPFPLVQIEEHEKICQKLKDEEEKVKKELAKSAIEYPETWEWKESNLKNTWKVGKEVFLIPLLSKSQEYSDIECLIDLTMKNFKLNVVNIWRIQNKPLYEKIFREKQKVKQEKDFLEVKSLFYAHPDVKTDHIYKNGFDISFAADNKPFGRGLHFERRCDKVINDGYKEQKNSHTCFIFLAEVLIGIPYVVDQKNNYKRNYNDFDDEDEENLNFNNGYNNNNNLGSASTFRKPPFYDEKKLIYFDSVTNVDNFSDLKDCDQTFAIYNNEKAYPLYMIEMNHIHKKPAK